jgi:hypothetical protein
LMAPKSIVYMIVAVFVGYMLVSAVPGQMAMYTAPTSGQKGDTITISGDGGEAVTLTGKGFSPENESASVEQGGSVEIYWDSVNLTDGREISVDNESIWFEIVRTNESTGFWVNNESISSEIYDLYEFSEERDAISDVAAVADLAAEASEAAADAVSSVASTAGEASVAAADAAEAASAAKSASSGLEFMGTMVWLTADIFVALVVYWFAKRRFA